MILLRRDGMKPVPLLVGGLVTAILAWFLLPRPSTAPHGPAADPADPTPPPSVRNPGAPRRPRHLPPTADRANVPRNTPAPPPAPATRDTGSRDADAPVYTADARGFRRAMRARMPALQECYDGWRAQDPTLSGEIVVRFTLEAPDAGSATSRVDAVEIVSSSLDHAFMEGCVLSSLDGLRFEALDGTKVFTYPLRFSPTGADK